MYKLSYENHCEWSKKQEKSHFICLKSKIVKYINNKDNLKGVTPMKKGNLGMNYLELFFVKSEVASDKLSF